MSPPMMDWHGITSALMVASRITPSKLFPRYSLEPAYVGLAVRVEQNNDVEVGLCLHDGTYGIDSAVERIEASDDVSEAGRAKSIEDRIVNQLLNYRRNHLLKYIGVGVTKELLDVCPQLCSALWHRLDVAPIVITPDMHSRLAREEDLREHGEATGSSSSMDAHSAARKCLTFFGPNHILRMHIGYYNVVEVDAAFKVVLVSGLEEYRSTVSAGTWRAVIKYAEQLKTANAKIAFFSSTPQGGGVALMRHAIMRFFHVLGIQASWYVPKPDPAVFRITKNNHNILQGVADPSVKLQEKDIHRWENWVHYNVDTYWACKGGPLSKEKCVDVAVVDDPQLLALIPLAKKSHPRLPIVYRSHIELRSDLISQKGSPQEGVWDYLWSNIQHADLFISHPVANFVPVNVDPKMVGLLPASTDWLDGLNKNLPDWDASYYLNKLRAVRNGMELKLNYPERKFIVQAARFDPSKGIPDVICAYVKFRQRLEGVMEASKTPQLLICGHGSVDDPDASIVYRETMDILDKYSEYAMDILVIQLGPSDQQLNTVLSLCHIAMQLSIREGFEVKVSEALHKGKPVIASKAGGIPLQVRDGVNGFLIPPRDADAAADRLYQLFTDNKLYKRMSEAAKAYVSDEVSTVGMALSWMYIFSKLSRGDQLAPNEQWIYEMARHDCEEEISPDEPRLNKSY